MRLTTLAVLILTALAINAPHSADACNSNGALCNPL